MPAAPQSSLFAFGPQVLVQDAECGVYYRPDVVAPDLAAAWFEQLREGVDWKTMQRPMYDRVVDVPRLVGFYRLDGELPGPLPEIAAWMRTQVDAPFNSVGLNYYRDGHDSVAMHNDRLQSLVAGHPIALLSLGSPRRMTIRAKAGARTSIHIDLDPGSLLVMSHASQHHWDHGIPKLRKRDVPPRMSLAFRVRPDELGGRRQERTLAPAKAPY